MKIEKNKQVYKKEREIIFLIFATSASYFTRIFFFQAVLLYGCTICTLLKLQVKKLDGNYARILCAILNNSWKHPPPKKNKTDAVWLLTSHLTNLQVRWAKHAEHCWKSKDELLHMNETVLIEQQILTFISSVQIPDAIWRIYWEQWMTDHERERVEGIHGVRMP